MSIASRVVGDDHLRDGCAAIYAAVIAVPPAERMNVTAVAIRALVDTGALDAYPAPTRSGEEER